MLDNPRSYSYTSRSARSLNEVNGSFGVSGGSISSEENPLAFTSSPDQSQKDTKQDSEELAPLFFFLASSFNVELVYIILKGITQFSYFNRQDQYQQRKCNKLAFTKQGEDMILTLNQIKVGDISKWREMCTDDDLKEVTKDIVNDYKAQRKMKLRQSYINKRKTAKLDGSAENIVIKKEV